MRYVRYTCPSEELADDGVGSGEDVRLDAQRLGTLGEQQVVVGRRVAEAADPRTAAGVCAITRTHTYVRDDSR